MVWRNNVCHCWHQVCMIYGSKANLLNAVVPCKHDAFLYVKLYKCKKDILLWMEG